jgi:hypothetical protein
VSTRSEAGHPPLYVMRRRLPQAAVRAATKTCRPPFYIILRRLPQAAVRVAAKTCRPPFYVILRRPPQAAVSKDAPPRLRASRRVAGAALLSMT